MSAQLAKLVAHFDDNFGQRPATGGWKFGIYFVGDNFGKRFIMLYPVTFYFQPAPIHPSATLRLSVAF